MSVNTDIDTDIFIYTQGLQRSSFLVMTHFLIRDYNILPKKELLWSPWVHIHASSGWRLPGPTQSVLVTA